MVTSGGPNPRRVGSAPRFGRSRRVADCGLLDALTFSDHAIARFAERAGVPSAGRDQLEALARALLWHEGRLMPYRPPWANSHSRADLYLQVGDWMLFIAEANPRPGEADYVVVTAITRQRDANWTEAYRRGHVRLAPPTATGPTAAARL
jgi:hypothetical protein